MAQHPQGPEIPALQLQELWGPGDPLKVPSSKHPQVTGTQLGQEGVTIWGWAPGVSAPRGAEALREDAQRSAC